MLSFMVLLYVLAVIALLILFKIYGCLPPKELNADTSLTEECATTLQTSCAAEMQE
jgi:hypothetical protein